MLSSLQLQAYNQLQQDRLSTKTEKYLEKLSHVTCIAVTLKVEMLFEHLTSHCREAYAIPTATKIEVRGHK